jgi:thiamine-monophosphate kinase
MTAALAGAADGEFGLIARHFARPPRDRSVVVGIGDDAAVLAPSPGCELLLAVDMMVEGRHFLAGTDPARLGHKLLAVNLSDLAAMGATPRWALLAGALPARDDAWLAAFAGGLHALAEAHAVDLVGGDTTRGPLALSLTIAGEVPAGKAILRSGARPGDDLWISGALGGAMLGLAALGGRVPLDPPDRSVCVARLERPDPRVALGLALRGLATAAIDVSDGLAGDLAHVARASGVRIEVEVGRVPRPAALDALLAAGPSHELALAALLAGGDDYELAFSAPPDARDAVERAARACATPLTRAGRVVAGSGVAFIGSEGAPLAWIPRAFDHFAAGSR